MQMKRSLNYSLFSIYVLKGAEQMLESMIRGSEHLSGKRKYLDCQIG